MGVMIFLLVIALAFCCVEIKGLLFENVEEADRRRSNAGSGSEGMQFDVPKVWIPVGGVIGASSPEQSVDSAS